jgi:indole-3-glycerol phosphate synthase
MSSSLLVSIVERKRREIDERKKAVFAGDSLGPEGFGDGWGADATLTSSDTGTGALRFEDALRSSGVSVIAEIKRFSPSKPDIRRDLDPKELAVAFERAGAAAISVLTDGPGFGGSLHDILEVRQATKLPILRKDFILDSIQVEEARAWGASAVLLIVAILDERQLRELLEAASTAGLAALTEVHSEAELETALATDARIVGVNNRDLHTFEVDLKTSLRLGPLIPEGVISVAESGITGPKDVEALGEAGFDAVLVGEGVLTQPDVERAVRILEEGGRSWRSRRG